MTDVDSGVSAPDILPLPPADELLQHEQDEELLTAVKPSDVEKVQQEEEVLPVSDQEHDAVDSRTDDKADEEQKEMTEQLHEEEKESSAHDDQQTLQPPLSARSPEAAAATITSSAHPVTSNNSDSDSDDDVDKVAQQPAAAPDSRPKTTRVSVLEQQIERDNKHDHEYHVPHLADFDFSTPPRTPSASSSPAAAATPIFQSSAASSTPSSQISLAVPAAAAAPAPFRFDPSIILMPDTERFSAASLPLLYPKLALTLAGTDVKVEVKLSALVCCVELLRSPLHTYELQAHGVLDELIVNAGAGDEQLRVLATEALTWAVRQREARQYCRENGVVGRMGALLIDHCVQVRINAAGVLLRLSASEPQLLYEAPVSAAAGDAASVMAFLVRRVQKDTNDEVRAQLLRCIQCGLTRRVGLIVARYNTLLPVLASLLPISHPPLIAAACDCVAAVAVDEVDRTELLSLSLHTPLLQWLALEDATVRRSAAGALMQATVGVAVKQAVVAAGGVQLCVDRIKGEESVEAVVCVLLQLLANLMESKAGKQIVAGDEALLAAVKSRAEDKTATTNLQLSAQSALRKLDYAP